VVVPQEYVENYGADTLRVYLLFLGPFDATLSWNERALMGVKRFLDRFERFIADHAGQSQEAGPRVKAAINRLGKEVSEDTAAFKYNTAIAHMMTALNTLNDLVVEPVGGQEEQIADRELRIFAQILAPYAPFTAQAGWKKAGGEGSVHASAWPHYDPNLELEEPVTIAIQVNGKLRATVRVNRLATEDEIRRQAETQPGVAKFLNAGKLVKVIYVPGRTMNYVVKQ
jgi:leucyl-tRNA synthetase